MRGGSVPGDLEIALLIPLDPRADDRAAVRAEVLDLAVDDVAHPPGRRFEVDRPVGVVELGPGEGDGLGAGVDASGHGLSVPVHLDQYRCAVVLARTPVAQP